MLRSLHIENYILIDSLDVKFPGGLVIITGQTGAGKSILLGAMSLVGGARADASVISESADNCVVEAEFSLDNEALRPLLEENEVEWFPDSLIVRRVISRSGRSRCFVNDSPVSLSLLSELSAHLVDIHSQHKSLLLTDKAFQLSVLDRFAGNGDLLDRCAALWKEMRGLQRRKSELESALSSAEADSDYNAAQYKQLAAAKLVDGELEALEEEQKMLANAGQIKESLSTAEALFSPEEGLSPVSALKEVSRQMEKISAYLPDAAALSERLESARIELEDVEADISTLNSKFDADGERLQVVEDRMSLLYTLLRKYSLNSVAELIALRDSLSASAGGSEAMKEELSDIEKELSTVRAGYDGVCAELHDAREGQAKLFAAEIGKKLAFLELDGSMFKVELESCQEGPSGKDAVRFLFASKGNRLLDVEKCASGGELSRIMLSLKAMMATFSGMPSLVFDEIDTGVSGSVADKMGSMICEMGKEMQVFSITHLPQVAAKGDAHYLVSRETLSDGKARSGLRKLDGEERVMELARLLSGAEISKEAVANARVLLGGN